MAVVATIVVATAMGAFENPTASKPQANLTGCAEPLAVINALAKNGKQDFSQTSYRYFRSLRSSIDYYASAWNTLIEIHQGSGDRRGQEEIAKRLLEDESAYAVLGRFDSRVLALRILGELEVLPESLSHSTQLKQYLQDGLEGDDIPVVSLELADRLIRRGSTIEQRPDRTIRTIRTIRTDGSAVTVDNFEQILVSQYGAPPGSPQVAGISKFLDSILDANPSGVGLYLLYLTHEMAPAELEGRSPNIYSYLNRLEARGGGYALTPGGGYDPQVSFYAAKLADVSIPESQLAKMKIRNIWILDQGQMPTGTATLADAVFHMCAGELGEPPRTPKDFTGCITDVFPTLNGESHKSYLADVPMGSARIQILSEFCRLDQPTGLERATALSTADGPRAITREFAEALLSPGGLRQFLGLLDENFVREDGCGVNPLAKNADLLSTVVCSGLGVLSDSDIASAKVRFRKNGTPMLYPEQPAIEQGSPEALLLYFLLENSSPEMARLALLL